MKKQKATQQQLLKRLVELGASLDDDPDSPQLYVDSPKGKIWTATGCHCICAPYRNSSQSWKAEAYAFLLEDMAGGLIDCDDPDCDICQEELGLEITKLRRALTR